MDFKKAYEDALERAKVIYNENPSSSTAKFVCGRIFPGLKQSEDERIRECLATIVKVNKRSSFGLECNHGATWDEMLAYLERQQEQQPADLNDAERKQLYSDGFDTARRALAGTFMQYLDEHRPEGKMCLSNGECAALAKAFKDGDVETIVRYINKYQQPAQVADASKMVQPESDLEKAARYVYESWMGGTMDDVRRDMVELGKVLNGRKEE